jgi:alkaline phosphatase D
MRAPVRSFDRRLFLKALAALGVAGAAPAYTQERPRFGEPPFALGVASGYPTQNGFVIWTRLVTDPGLPGGDIDPVRTRVNWEVARDDKMRDIAASGMDFAVPAWAHSTHIEVEGLEPDRPYWYRFNVGSAESPIGRTRTAPAARSVPARFRFAFASCQHFEHGHFGAYRHILADDPDLIAFLGDYIYGRHADRNPVRSHASSEPRTLSRYRVRHALYKSDPDLRAAHAAVPWICTWDDQEVTDHYAGDQMDEEVPLEVAVARRLVAYKAYYEHMPLRHRMRPTADGMRIYAQMGWGDLARFFLLDGRQYRTPQACPAPDRKVGANTVDVAACPQLAEPQRTMLGRRQEAWLETSLELTPARWNVLAQQTLMAQLDQQPGPGRRVWTDGWDGYPGSRRKLLEFIAAKKTPNPVVIGGDMHAFYVADLKPDFDQPKSPVVASEFVGTSISSHSSWTPERAAQMLADNPHIKFADNGHRGYVRVEVTPRQWRADLRAMESVVKPDAACNTLASFVVEDGRPGARRV